MKLCRSPMARAPGFSGDGRAKKKATPARRGFVSCSKPAANSRRSRSALRELEAAAGFLLAVLLALDDARVARQEAFALQGRTQVGLVIGQRLGEAVAHRAGLT